MSRITTKIVRKLAIEAGYVKISRVERTGEEGYMWCNEHEDEHFVEDFRLTFEDGTRTTVQIWDCDGIEIRPQE